MTTLDRFRLRMALFRIEAQGFVGRRRRLRSVVWPITRGLSRAKWWVLHRFHPRHRYHVVRTGLKPGYHDPDRRIEAVIARELIDLVEAGRLNPRHWPENHESHINLARLQELAVKLSGVFEHQTEYEGLDYEERTELLVEVVRLRNHLWY